MQRNEETTPFGRKDRWGAVAVYEHPKCVPAPDRGDGKKWMMMAPGQDPTYYKVADRFGPDERRGRFKTQEAAERKAEELNLFERRGGKTPTPEAKARLRRLKRLPGSLFGVRYNGQDPPIDPPRWAIVAWSERYSESFVDLYETRDEAEAAMEQYDELFDLDTGKLVATTGVVVRSVS